MLEAYRQIPLDARGEACVVHSTVLKPSDHFIVVRWFQHDKWMANGSREFVREVSVDGK